MYKPHDYQQHCINHILNNKSAGLFLDMGLGKTSITLSAILELKYMRFEINKVLIIAPKKVAENTWQAEAKKWNHLGLLNISTMLGTKKQRERALHAKADIYIINRDNVSSLVDTLRGEWFFDMVVIDELTSFKNHQAKRFKALKSIRSHIKRIVGLTGTPVPNGYIDLWAQLYLLDQGERLGRYISHFRDRYFNPGQRNQTVIFNYKLKPGAEESIKDLIGDICISMKAEDYLSMPEVIVNDIIVPLDSKAKRAYTDFEKEMLLEIDENEITATSAAALNIKLMQIANGAVYDENRKVIEIHNNKLEMFMECVEGLNGESALVLYNFKHDLDRIMKCLKKTGLRVRYLQSKQDEIDWNNGLIDILLAHPASCAFGLNLQVGGHHVIWFSPNYSRELYDQANARINRQGQEKPVFIHRLICQDTIDEDIIKSLEKKGDVSNTVMEILKARIKKIKGVEKREVKEFVNQAEHNALNIVREKYTKLYIGGNNG